MDIPVYRPIKGEMKYGPAELQADGELAWSFPMIHDGEKWIDILRDPKGMDVFKEISSEISGGSQPPSPLKHPLS